MNSVNCVSRRGFYLAISEPPVIVPKDPPFPGQGHYDIRDTNCLYPKPTAAFASRTERILQDSLGGMTPGPGNA